MLPTEFDLANYPTTDTIRLLASLLERMTIANDLLNKQPQQQGQYTRFHARLVPSIDIYSYLSRIYKYCPCSNECFLSLLVYFDRMSKNSLAITKQPFTIDSFNIHRLIISGVMVASKFFSDVFYTNTRYAKVGGLPVTELNNLEIEFLKLNEFNLTVPISELQKYGDQLLKVGYITTQKPATAYRHTRSSSFDQTRLSDLTQRMSLTDQHQLQKRNNNNNKGIRRMTSTSSLKDNQRYYEQPRHSRSSVNLSQGFWKPNSPFEQQQSTTSSSRKLSITSIHAPPFIPQQQQQQQQQYYYYQHPIGIPTPPPSASPVYHNNKGSSNNNYYNNNNSSSSLL